MYSPAAPHERAFLREGKRSLATKRKSAGAGRAGAHVQGLGVSIYLFLFAAALLVPVFVLAASALALFIDAQRSLLWYEAAHRAGTTAIIVGRNLARLKQVARDLAKHSVLDGDDVGRSARVAARDGRVVGMRIILSDASGREILHDTGGAAGGAGGREAVDMERHAALQHAPLVSGLFFSPTSQGRGVFVAVAPAIRDREVRYIVSAIADADLISREIRQQLPRDGTMIVVVDSGGLVVARADEGPLAVPAPDWLWDLGDDAVAGAFDGSEVRRLPTAAAVRLPDDGLTVAAHLASATAFSTPRAIGLFGIAGAALIGFGAAAALVFGRRIARSVRLLAAFGIRLARDHAARPLSSPVAEVNEVGAALMQAAEIRRELERELRQAHKMEAIGRLTGGIAHDFNNLLTIIIGNLEMLVDDGAGALSEEQARLVADAQESAALSAHLVNQLLVFARRQPLDPVIADVGQLVRNTGHLLARTIGEAIELKIDADASLRARVDVPQFETVILNLAINARDAMPRGGTLGIAVRRVHVEEGMAARLALRAGGYVAVTVTDTGTGMTKEVRERAFEPFFTTKPPGIGTGLGLSVVYGFVKQSGGDAWLRSDVGRGTTVEFWIPEADGLPTVAAPGVCAVPARRVDRADITILVVDDHAKVRELAARVLRLLGYAVVEAADGPAALDLLSEGLAVDILLTDVAMPGMNGDELAGRALKTRPHLRVLYMSGHADGDDVPGRLSGNAAWLRKPYTSAQLTAVVDELLSRPAACAAT